VTAVGVLIPDLNTLTKEGFGIVLWLADEGMLVVVGSITL